MSRNYSNFAKTASLAAPVAAGDTSIDVDTQTDYPAPSYVIVVYEGASTPQAAPKKEVMKANGVTDNGDGTFTLTVDRDIDGYNGGGISFSNAATVEHTVVADEVGPKRSIVNSQITAKADDLDAFGDFEVSASDANGYTLKSGHTLTVQQGQAEIQNGELRPAIDDGTRVIVTFTLSTRLRDAWITKRTGANDGIGSVGGLITRYTDANNYAFASTHRINSNFVPGILAVSSGSETLKSSGDQIHTGGLHNSLVPLFVHTSPNYGGNTSVVSLEENAQTTTDEGGTEVGFVFDTGNGAHGIKSVAIRTG